MRIVEIEIEKLFGIFDHRIRLNTDDRVTIIHGPNGFGKTVLLELVHGLFNGRYAKLGQIPFHQLAVLFDDDSKLLAHQVATDASPSDEDVVLALTGEGLSPVNRIKLALQTGDTGQRPEEFLLDTISADRSVPLPIPLPSPPTHLDPLEDEVARQNPFRESALAALGRRLGLKSPATQKEEPVWWRDIKSSVRVDMIREQRLLRKALRLDWQQTTRPLESTWAPAVQEYAKDLAQRLGQKLEEFAEVSQTLERTFPARLLQREHGNGPSEHELRAKLEALERRRSKLEEAGLLEGQQETLGQVAANIDAEMREVLAVWVEDAEKKLATFDELAERIDLFQDIINSRFLYKQLRISRRDGFVVTTANGERLPLTALSSGEQQEMVLLYELLFRMAPDSLVLIDEPELSLHVAWQTKFLDDLIRISELASFDVLIATHSPQIIHTRWDLTVELEGPKAEVELAATTIP